MVDKQIYNPFLPLNEYIPDGEPHVFGDRVYLYGSHDKEGGDKFCLLDYVCYSAPVTDLKDWKYEGVIYSTKQDPANLEGQNKKKYYMYAPDVMRGNDGRYYLYYCSEGFTRPIRVAVCDTPAGKYEFYGYVKNADGTPYVKRLPMDPGVINDNGVIRYYGGWSLHLPKNALTFFPLLMTKKMLFGKVRDKDYKGEIQGAFTVELDDDMLTVRTQPKLVAPGRIEAKGTPFYDHAFYEASSIRKIGEKYYFIYSSHVNHELCYAISNYPDRDFKYGGVIISNGDVGYNGRKPKDRINTTGNIHGSIENINDEWYVFYHRHTHNTTFSRQACAEKIQVLPDGSIPQVELTSCGLNGGPLKAEVQYPASICCNLYKGKMKNLVNGKSKADKPFITHSGNERFITKIKNKTVIGYKYFEFDGTAEIAVTTRGGGGKFIVSTTPNGNNLGEIILPKSNNWIEIRTKLKPLNGVYPLYFRYEGKGKVDFLDFEFIQNKMIMEEK